MMKRVKIILSLTALLLTNNASAAWSGYLLINKIWIEDTQVRIGFSTLPEGCDTHLYSMHAYMDSDTSLFKEKMAMLLTAKALGQQIDIWYTDNGDCSTFETMMDIYKIGISSGQ